MNQELKEQAHKEFDERLPQMITDLIWAVTDGGQKIEPKRFLSYQEEPVYEFEQIKSFIDSLIDKTVQMERDRILNFINSGYPAPATDTGWSINLDDVADFITNKNNIKS